MTNIVLLDSDEKALDQLVKSLRAMHDDWQLSPVTSGRQALKHIKDNNDVDVIISETVVSDMKGVDVLDNIRESFPTIIRFSVSHNSDDEVVMENARANHRFINKSVEPTIIAAAIESSMKLREILQNEELATYMRNVNSVPALPAIYDEMMQELSSPHSSLLKVGDIVESDAGLTITVLKIVNSAFYGLNRRVESVAQAVTLLGVHLIKNITLTAKVFSKFEGSQLSLRRLTELNNQAMQMGAISNQFARFARLPKAQVDHCQIAGMMCNVGELIAAVKSEEDASAQTQEDDTPADNATPLPASLLGAYLLRVWMMPDPIVEAVALQYDPTPPTCMAITPLTVVYSIRYLQTHFSNTSDPEQRLACAKHLETFIAAEIVDRWLDAYQAIEELTGDGSRQAA